MRVLGSYIKDVVKLNKKNFKIFGPDEALSNRLNKVFEATKRKWNAETYDNDEFLNSEGAVFDSYLSEHMNMVQMKQLPLIFQMRTLQRLSDFRQAITSPEQML